MAGKVRIRIIFKSGAILDLEVTEWKIRKNVTNEIVEFTHADTKPRLAYINLSEIAAFIEL